MDTYPPCMECPVEANTCVARLEYKDDSPAHQICELPTGNYSVIICKDGVVIFTKACDAP